jgi:type VI protein secretion system component VasK
MKHQLLFLGIGFWLAAIAPGIPASIALPPPEDIPEEVLRTEIITEARSPIDGKPLTAAQYAELQAQLAQSPYPLQLDPKVGHLVFELKLLKLLRTFVPFFPL